MANNRALTDEQIAEVNRLYDDGWTYVALAQHFFIDDGTIKRYVVNKRPRVTHVIKDEDVPELNRLYEKEGKTYMQLAEMYGVSQTTIRKHIVNRRGRQRGGYYKYAPK